MTFNKIIILILFVLPFNFASATNNSSCTTNDDGNNTHQDPTQISTTDSIVNFGKLFLNTPYRYGSPGSSSFDCSGFTSYVYRNFGFNLKRSSAEQAQQFDTVKKNEVKPGDLVYFSGSCRSKRVGHVGIVVNAKGDGTFEFIHAAVRKGVTISSSEESYYSRRYVKANRVIGFNDLLAVKPNQNDNIPNLANDEPIVPIAYPENVQRSKKIIPSKYHTVKKGETLSSIAKKYNLSIAELKELNGLENSKLKTKQQLTIKEQEVIMLIEPKSSIAKNKTIEDSKNQINSASQNTELTVENPTTHIVKKGETLFSIANLYNVTVEDLEKTNNLKSKKIRFGQEIRIANTLSENTNNTTSNDLPKTPTYIKYKIKRGETLSSIAKANNTSIEEIKKINDFKSTSVKYGQEIKLVSNIALETNSNDQINSEKSLAQTSHQVKPGESLYTIAKLYNTTIENLKKINNLNDSKIKTGQSISISETMPISNIDNKNTDSQITHKVKSGDSFFSLAKKYGCSVNDLKTWNKKPSNKLNPGDKLIIYVKNSQS